MLKTKSFSLWGSMAKLSALTVRPRTAQLWTCCLLTLHYIDMHVHYCPPDLSPGDRCGEVRERPGERGRPGPAGALNRYSLTFLGEGHRPCQENYTCQQSTLKHRTCQPVDQDGEGNIGIPWHCVVKSFLNNHLPRSLSRAGTQGSPQFTVQ